MNRQKSSFTLSHIVYTAFDFVIEHSERWIGMNIKSSCETVPVTEVFMPFSIHFAMSMTRILLSILALVFVDVVHQLEIGNLRRDRGFTSHYRYKTQRVCD